MAKYWDQLSRLVYARLCADITQPAISKTNNRVSNLDICVWGHNIYGSLFGLASAVGFPFRRPTVRGSLIPKPLLKIPKKLHHVVFGWHDIESSGPAEEQGLNVRMHTDSPQQLLCDQWRSTIPAVFLKVSAHRAAIVAFVAVVYNGPKIGRHRTETWYRESGWNIISQPFSTGNLSHDWSLA